MDQPFTSGGPCLKQVMVETRLSKAKTGRYVSAALGVAKGLKLACPQGKSWEFREAEGRDASAGLSTPTSFSGDIALYRAHRTLMNIWKAPTSKKQFTQPIPFLNLALIPSNQSDLAQAFSTPSYYIYLKKKKSVSYNMTVNQSERDRGCGICS